MCDDDELLDEFSIDDSQHEGNDEKMEKQEAIRNDHIQEDSEESERDSEESDEDFVSLAQKRKQKKHKRIEMGC